MLLGLILFVAPLVRGGNREVASAVLLALGLGVLALLASSATAALVVRLGARRGSADVASGGGGWRAPGRSLWWWAALGLLALSPVWIGLLHLSEWPADTWTTLAGRQMYADTLGAALGRLPEHLPLSLLPEATWSALWATLPVAAVFVAAQVLDDTEHERLLMVILLAAALQVVVSVLQFGLGGRSPLYFGATSGGGFIGTFANRNHLADFFAMSIPLWFYFLYRRQKLAARNQHDRVFGVDLGGAAMGPLWLFLGFSLVVLLLSTQSRGGALAAAIVSAGSIGLYFVALRSSLSKKQRYLLLAAALTLATLAIATVGLDVITARVQGERLQTDAETRNVMAWSTFEAAVQFWPLGSGMGTFEGVFPRFQDRSTIGYVPHAHNDYAQMLMELGAVSIILVCTALALALQQMYRLYQTYTKDGRLNTAVALRCYSLLGVLALVLHSWVEFNMHIPALAITAAFLAGAYLRPLARS